MRLLLFVGMVLMSAAVLQASPTTVADASQFGGGFGGGGSGPNGGEGGRHGPDADPKYWARGPAVGVGERYATVVSGSRYTDRRLMNRRLLEDSGPSSWRYADSSDYNQRYDTLKQRTRGTIAGTRAYTAATTAEARFNRPDTVTKP